MEVFVVQTPATPSEMEMETAEGQESTSKSSSSMKAPQLRTSTPVVSTYGEPSVAVGTPIAGVSSVS